MKRTMVINGAFFNMQCKDGQYPRNAYRLVE